MKYPSGKAVTKQDRIEALGRLREWLKDGDTLYFILRHRAASGMMRVYDVKHLTVTIDLDSVDSIGGQRVFERLSNQSVHVATLSWNIASACDMHWNETHGGIRVNGYGFSGKQEIADTVGQALGIKLKYETL